MFCKRNKLNVFTKPQNLRDKAGTIPLTEISLLEPHNYIQEVGYIVQLFSIGNGYIVLSGISLLRNTDGAKTKIEPPLTKIVNINAKKMLIPMATSRWLRLTIVKI
ncbi:hypothetical protein V1478_013308 [Vespula squamosa]|uniref:Uncharacterized protein n=1 Tax=Vespula squamosa TaxID=30214 RepID=A0ABD2AAG2_VESSQ